MDARRWSFEAAFAPGADTRGWYQALRNDGMRVRELPPLARRARPGWLAALVGQGPGPVILHTHFARWDVPAVLVARRDRRRDPVAVIWHRHGELSRRPWLLGRDLVRYGLVGRAVDAHLCVGPGGQAQLRARGAPRDRTLLLANPVDIGRFPVADAQERLQARADLQLESGVSVLAAFTWEWERKGGPLLLDLVRELDRRGRPVTALLVGGGPRARDAVRRLGIERQVRVLEPRGDPRVFFAAADVFLAPSRAEAFGFAPHEAICCGTPVVASDVSGHRYHGVHLAAMQLVALGAGVIADAVEAELAADPTERAARVAASRDYLKHHAGYDAWVQRLLQVYDDVLARRGLRGTADLETTAAS